MFVAPASREQIGFYYGQFIDTIETQFGGITKVIETAQKSNLLLAEVESLKHEISRLEAELIIANKNITEKEIELAKCKSESKAKPAMAPKSKPASASKPKGKGGK